MTRQTLTKYAAYDDASIYAVANSASGAIRKARADAREPKAVFQTAPISEDLYVNIKRYGWDGRNKSFRIDGGFLIDTTGE